MHRVWHWFWQHFLLGTAIILPGVRIVEREPVGFADWRYHARCWCGHTWSFDV